VVLFLRPEAGDINLVMEILFLVMLRGLKPTFKRAVFYPSGVVTWS